jgi:hypothetical protein
MAKKAKATGKMSSGNKATQNRAREERRQAKFAKKREEGRAYEYKPIPYAKGTVEYAHEKLERAEKTVSKKTPVARLTSLMRKLDNQLAKEKMERKNNKEKFGNRKVARA